MSKFVQKATAFVGWLLMELYLLAGGIFTLVFYFSYIQGAIGQMHSFAIILMGVTMLLLWLSSFSGSWLKFPIANLIQFIAYEADDLLSVLDSWCLVKGFVRYICTWPAKAVRYTAEAWSAYRDFSIAFEWWSAGYDLPNRAQVRTYGRLK